MLTPSDETELAEAVKTAQGPLAIRGGGTRPVGRPVRGDDLSVAGLSGITLYEPGALTVVAKAGTPVAGIEAALMAEGQMLAFEPMDHRALLGTTGEPTIGGVVAANVSGPRRVQAGAARDYLLGVRFVDGRGEVIKNGGRVMKNVTGYDLARLMCGARGTLGILSEVSLKVLPRPEAVSAILLTGLSTKRAVAAMSAALASPFQVTGAAHVPKALDGDPVTMIRIEGFEDSVTYRAERLREHLSEFGAGEIERRTGEDGGHGTTAGWRWIRDVAAFREKVAVWRVSVKPSEAAALLDSGPWRDRGCDAVLDWGGGLVWIGADEGQVSGDTGVTLHTALQDRLGQTGGHATLVKGPEALRSAVPAFQPEAAPLAKLAEAMRRQFDPRGILNTGLMG